MPSFGSARRERDHSAGVTRRTLLGAAIAGAGAAALGRATRVSAATDRLPHPRTGRSWPMAHHDLHGWRRGGSGATSLGPRWRASLAGGVPGAAAVVRGRVYAASYGAEVIACELSTGDELWRRALPLPTYGDVPMGFFGGPAITGRRMLVASDRVFCLDTADGATLWESEPLRSPESDDYFWAPPVAIGGLVLIGSGSGSEAAARGRVTAYDLGDGALRWSTPMVPEDGNGGGVIQPCTVDIRRRVVYVATGSPYVTLPGPNPGTSSLVALRLRDGYPLWQDQVHPGDRLGLDLNSAVIIAGRLLVATAKDGVYAWDAVERRRLWHRQLTPAESSPGAGAGPTNGPEMGPIAFDGRRLYVLSNDDENARHAAAALDPRTGSVLWSRWLSGFAFAAPAVADGLLYASSSEGTLTALRTGDGSIAASGALGNPSAGAVSVARESTLAGTGAGADLPGEELVCFGAG